MPKSGIFGHKFWHFCFFVKIFGKFEGADFKYANTSFKIVAQKYPDIAFLVKITQISHFWFFLFALGQIRGCWFQIWQ